MKNSLVMVVDDDRSERKIISAALKKFNFNIIEARGGREAVQLFQSEKPDVVLLDVMMPDIDGFETCEMIKQFPEGTYTQILMVTGLEDVKSIEKAFEVGANDFVTKPLNLALLGQRVQYMLRAGHAFKELHVNRSRLICKHRALKLRSECNKLIVHAVNESDILKHICRVIVENGNYRFAWIGFAAEDKEKIVNPVAQYGVDGNCLDNMNMIRVDTEFGQNPVVKMMQDKKTLIIKKISSGTDVTPWEKKLERMGYLSSIFLPLTFEHHVLGVLSIHASEKDVYNTEETKLLEELTNDLAHGIMAIRFQENLRRTEKSLRTRHDMLQGILNVMSDSVYIVSSGHIIEFQNDICRETFGSFVGKTCYKSFFHLNEPCEFCLMKKAFLENITPPLETTMINQKQYDISFSSFLKPDGSKKSVVVMRDITEKKRLEAETVRAGQLSSLGELAAGVAHEINNPVTGIISIAEILTDKFHQLGGDKKIPERIVHEGERIGNIVKNLLSFAKDKKEERSPAHVKDILRLALELVEKQILKDGVHLSVHIPSDIPKIQARSQEIQQVFLNLISNARYALKKKYANADGNKILKINGEVIKMGGKKYVRLIFHDRGQGIPEKFIDKVTDPFFSTKPQGEGTGLGLSISHGIIKNHGGNLWFESKESQYTKVMVDFPIDNGQPSKETYETKDPYH